MKQLVMLFVFLVIHCVQAIETFAQQDCYTKYIQRGEAAVRKKNYEFAIKQYQAAKVCDGIGYEELSKINSLINSSYARWVKELEEARKAADAAAATSLLESAHKLLMEGKFMEISKNIQNSPFTNSPPVVDYLSDLNPFVPYASYDEPLAFDSLSYREKNYLAVVQLKLSNTNKLANRKTRRQTDASQDQENENSESGDKSAQFVLLELTDAGIKNVVEYPIEDVVSSDRFSFKKVSDSLLIRKNSITTNYLNLATLAINKLNNPDYTNRSTTVAKSETYQLLSAHLSQHDLSFSVEHSDGVNSYVKRAVITIQQKTTGKELLKETNIYSLEYLDSLKLLLLITQNELDSTYKLKILSVPSLKETFSQSNLKYIPSFVYLKNNYLLAMEIKVDTVYKDSIRDASGFTYRSRNTKMVFYDLIASHSIDRKKSPGNYADYYKRTANGFIRASSYEIVLLDKYLTEIKQYKYDYYWKYQYHPRHDKLLILKDNFQDRSSSIRIVSDRSAKPANFDTLVVFNLASGDSVVHTGRQIQFLNDSLFSIIKDSSIEVFNFAKRNDERIFFSENLNTVKINLYKHYLWLVETKARADTTVSIFSLKNNKRIVYTGKMINREPNYMYFCSTGNSELQEFFWLDTLSDVLSSMVVKIPRKELAKSKPYFLPRQNLLYTISSYESSEEEGEEAEMLMTIFGNDSKKLFRYLAVSTVKIYHLKSGKTKTIKTPEDLKYDHPLMIGNFMVIEARSALISESDNEKIHLFKLGF